MRRPVIDVQPTDSLPDQRTHNGTRADRAEHLTWRMRLRYTVVLIIAVAAAYASGQAIETAHDAHRLAGRVTRDEHSTTANRVENVSTWCNAINTIQTELDAYVHAAAVDNPTTQLPPLGLHQLPCAAIEHRTAASTKASR